ncbi:MAG: polyprenyl synthetase family protein [Bacteroidales bacterium]
MYTFEEIKNFIEKKLSEIKLKDHPRKLYFPIRYTLESGGKRIRPAMVLMACNLFKDTIEDALSPALAIEIFHNFTLLHDDIMDNSKKRRGRDTVHQKWNSNIAILSGDAMAIKAYGLLSETSEDKLHKVLDLFNQTALRVCEGQQLDMDYEDKDTVSEEEYLEMIELKTAVLLACSLKLGAIAGDAEESDAQNIYEFGRYLGLAFQLQDDLLDLYADPAVLGKNTGGDIVAGKKTYLYFKAYEKASAKDKQELRNLINSVSLEPEQKINQIKVIYDSYNVFSLTSEKIYEYYKEAIKCFDNIKVSANRKEPLLNLAHYIMNRKK